MLIELAIAGIIIGFTLTIIGILKDRREFDEEKEKEWMMRALEKKNPGDERKKK